MQVTVLEAGNLPTDAFLSVRVGETKRLRPFRAGESFTFAKGGDTGFIQLDAFEKLGSIMTRGLHAEGGKNAGKEQLQDVCIPTACGPCISAKIRVAAAEQQPPLGERRERLQTRHKLALDAKNYLDCNDIWGPVQGMVHALLKHRPQDPVGYMIAYLSDAQRSRSRRDAAAAPLLPERSKATPPVAPYAAGRHDAAEATLKPKLPPPLPPPRDLEPAGDPTSFTPSAKTRAAHGLLTGLHNGTLHRLAAEMQSTEEEEVEPIVPGFPVDACPGHMPDLSDHHSLMAEVLQADGRIYDALKDQRTSLGSTFAGCVKPGMDSPADPIGVVAGDEACYDVFRELFDPVIERWHGTTCGPCFCQPTDLSLEKVCSLPIDATGRYAISVRVRGGRNLRGLRLPSACSHKERCEVERVLSRAVGRLQDGDLVGEYLPLPGSTTWPARPGGMADHEAAELHRHHLLFRKPEDGASAGLARRWPQARGIFAARSRGLAVWCNEEEHCRVISLGLGHDVAAAFSRYARAVWGIERSLEEHGYEFARSPRLGFIATCPSNLGTGLRVSVMLRLPLLLAQPACGQVCGSLGLRMQSGVADLCEVTNCSRLGISEVDSVNQVIQGCARLVALEQRLEQQQATDGLGDVGAVAGLNGADNRCPGAFPRDVCPGELPDLSGHHNMMACVLRNDGGIYKRLQHRSTRLGVGLATCIKPGMDNPGHPMLTAVGMIAGDEECYEVFQELFDPIIQCRHGTGAAGLGRHPTDLAAESVLDVNIDPSGRYAISARVRGRRSLAGFRLPPACDRSERTEVESVLVKALSSLRDQDLHGTYYPLRNSCSFPQRPNGMSAQEEGSLEERDCIFFEPDSLVMLCSGLGRDWPHARGVFSSESQRLVAWLNEEDHLRLVSSQPGAGLKEAFSRFARAMQLLEGTMANDCYSFARSERLGYITTCPLNLGTGLRASMLLRLPLLSRHPAFQDICHGLGIQASCGWQCSAGEILEPGVCDVAGLGRIGTSEVELISSVAQGCAKLVAMEQALERGEELSSDPGAAA